MVHVNQIIILYTLILHNVVCQLYLTEAGKNNKVVNFMLCVFYHKIIITQREKTFASAHDKVTMVGLILLHESEH